MDSYFSILPLCYAALYHEKENDTKQEDKIKYEDDLLKNHGYERLCKGSPFGYNIPRFKNLSIEQLFDRNEYLTEK